MRNTNRKNRKILSSGNPFLGDAVLDKKMAQSADYVDNTMSVKGAIDKTFILFSILMVASALSFKVGSMGLAIFGAIAGFIVVLVSVWRPKYSNITGPLYAALEGLFVGGISAVYASVYDGIIFKAVSLTFALLFVMLFLYRSGMIQVTNKFRMGVMMATGAVFLVYMASFILGFFGVNLPFLHDGGPISIGISLVIIGIASFNLLLDFDNFDKGEENGMPRYFEWFFAMGLIITLVWLYLEILRLLAMLNNE